MNDLFENESGFENEDTKEISGYAIYAPKQKEMTKVNSSLYSNEYE